MQHNMLRKMPATMRATVFFHLLLLAQLIPLVRSNSTSVEKKLSLLESITEVINLPCTSRTLSDIALNVTAYDDSDPYCPDGYFCDLFLDDDEDSIDQVLGLCKPCSGDANNCSSVALLDESDPRPDSMTFLLEIAVEEECQNQCGEKKNTCLSVDDCPIGLFCNFANGEEGGYCEKCPFHIIGCEEDLTHLTGQGMISCEATCSIVCNTKPVLGITDPATGETDYIEDVNTMNGSPQLSATGPIVDCGLGLEACEGAEGAICLIERGILPFVNKTRNCHEGGGIAAVIYNVEASCENIRGTFGGQDVWIPSISLPHFEGKNILDRAKAMPPETPLIATVAVGGHDTPPSYCTLGCIKGNECEGTDLICDWDNGHFGDCRDEEQGIHCSKDANFLNDELPCTGERQFCDFSLGGRGYCQSCPEVDGGCFFSNLNVDAVKECNEVCTDGGLSEVNAAPCKFCPKGNFGLANITDGFQSTEKEEVTTPCQFCNTTTASTCSTPDRWDMQYPERTVTLFGIEVECWKVAEFYRNINIEANTVECDSIRSFNYICGCSDSPGYAGANTDAKKLALVWLPRIGAMLSLVGSSMMIIGVRFDEKRKKQVIGDLIVALCAFDMVGSIGYLFTSYPTPIEDHIQGAQGNDASCKAQGFFIQVGTISLYINVSIAFYYLLIIKYSWREHRLKKSRVHYLLFAVPIFFGAIFAFAGIPYYDNAILWCNNSRKYWSEIPVAIAILIATVIMFSLCWFVFISERASQRFRRHSVEDRSSLATKFFKQSLVYLGAFYLTWPPYLALQIMIANGKAYSNYGFILYAGTAVTLQGFWNYVFHVGLNGKSIKQSVKATWTTVRSQAGSVTFSKSKKSESDSKFMPSDSRFTASKPLEDSRAENSKVMFEDSEGAGEESTAEKPSLFGPTL